MDESKPLPTTSVSAPGSGTAVPHRPQNTGTATCAQGTTVYCLSVFLSFNDRLVPSLWVSNF